MIFYDSQNNAVGFYDDYNMNPSDRDFAAELKTRAGWFFGWLGGLAQPYDVVFGTFQKPVK